MQLSKEEISLLISIGGKFQFAEPVIEEPSLDALVEPIQTKENDEEDEDFITISKDEYDILIEKSPSYDAIKDLIINSKY